MTEKTTALLVVSDEPIFRACLAHLLASEEGFEVRGETTSRGAAQTAIELRPDVVLLLSQDRCATTVGALRATVPHVPQVVLDQKEDIAYVRLLLAVGALGYVLLRASTQALFNAIRAAAASRRYIDPHLMSGGHKCLSRN